MSGEIPEGFSKIGETSTFSDNLEDFEVKSVGNISGTRFPSFEEKDFFGITNVRPKPVVLMMEDLKEEHPSVDEGRIMNILICLEDIWGESDVGGGMYKVAKTCIEKDIGEEELELVSHCLEHELDGLTKDGISIMVSSDYVHISSKDNTEKNILGETKERIEVGLKEPLDLGFDPLVPHGSIHHTDAR